MSACKLYFVAQALADLKGLDKSSQRRVLEKLRWLAQNAELTKHERLKGGLACFYKLRIGDYRAIYSFSLEERVVVVQAVGHRTKIYRQLL